MVEETFADEAYKALGNLRVVLQDAGASVKNIVRISVVLTSRDHWPELKTIFADFFGEHQPAREIPVITEMTVPDARVGFSVIAVKY